MEVVFIDANIFLEILLKDKKSEPCKSFLRLLESRGITAITSDFIIYTCFIQIERNLKGSKSIKEAILFFNSLGNLRVLRPVIDDFYMAAEIMDAYKLDFDDSLVVACMKTNGIAKLTSLDKHFDKVKGLQRINL